jgi:hypothetical protein
VRLTIQPDISLYLKCNEGELLTTSAFADTLFYHRGEQHSGALTPEGAPVEVNTRASLLAGKLIRGDALLLFRYSYSLWSFRWLIRP